MAKLPSTNIQTSKERKYKHRSQKRGRVVRTHAIQKGKFEKTIPHHGMDGWMGGGNGSQVQIKHCNRSKHGFIQFGLEKGKKYETSKLKVWNTMEWRLGVSHDMEDLRKSSESP